MPSAEPSACSKFFFSGGRRHTSWPRDWSSDVCSSDLQVEDAIRGSAFPADQQGDGGFHGNSTGTRQCIESTDGKVSHHGENNTKEHAAARCEVAHAVSRNCHGDNRSHRKQHSGDEEADDRWPEVSTGANSHHRWEDKVAGAKEHRKQR